MVSLRPYLLLALLPRKAVSFKLGTTVVAPEELVQLLAGTELSDEFSNGNTLPQVKRPWGFNDWVPHTSGTVEHNPWFFHRSATTFKGMRCSHQPSPWLGDWGFFSFLPELTVPSNGFHVSSLRYSPDDSTWRPYLFKTLLSKKVPNEDASRPSQQISLEFTPTNHAAAARIIFPTAQSESEGSIVVNVPNGNAVVNGSLIVGYTETASGKTPEGFKMYFVIHFSKSPSHVEEMTCHAATPCSVPRLFFGRDAGTLELQMATSLISAQQAARNLKREVGSMSFDEVVQEGRQVWSEALGRVRVQMPKETQYKVFYTNLWKAMLFPRFIHEMDEDGKEVHYSPFSGQVHPGKLVTDSGFWDAYHTVYPLNSVVFPENLGHMMDGWVNAYQENGWIPQWPSPANRASMTGTMSDVSIADAIVKSEAGGFTFNKTLAYEAIRKDALTEPGVDRNGEKTNGRNELEEYDRLGFVTEQLSNGRESQALVGHRVEEASISVQNGMLHKVNSPLYTPIELGESKAGSTRQVVAHTETVSRTLNNAVADAAIARAADALGHTEEGERLAKRARKASEALFNRQSKFFQPKSGNGDWQAAFEPLAWRRGFTEGSAYHYRYYLPHDVELLQELFDGQLCEAIKADLEHTNPPIFKPGGYNFAIHEMKEHEKVSSQFGMYNHCNQPGHEVLWTAKKAGCDEIADKYLRRVMDQLYTTEGWCGDEDNGEMGSWYVLSALGIYSLEGARDELVLGSPAVSSASVRLPEGRGELKVVATNQGAKNVYVHSVTWTPTGGSPEPVRGNVIKYSTLMSGGQLEFTMGASPRANAAGQRLRGPGM